MVNVARVEAVISAQNRLRPGLSAAAADLGRFRAQQQAAATLFNATAARAAIHSAKQAAGARVAAERRAGTAAMLVAARSRSEGAGRAASVLAGGVSAKALGAVGGVYAGGVALRYATRQALSFEKGMYDVQRATDTSGQALRDQETFLLNLSRATGKTKEELAQLYAAGGFAGRPINELGRFTEYAAKATVAWGTSAEDTGQAMAEIGNIYGVTQSRIEEIGDTINTVADKSASKESDLIQYLTRVGGAGKLVGISAENMLAFGAALKEVGVRTDVAATGMSAVLNKALVQDDGFDKNLKKIGVNVKSFRNLVEKDATGAIIQLLSAVEKLEGTKRLSILKDMFGLEYADDVGRLVGSLPRLNELLKVANDRAGTLGSVRSGFGLALEKDFNKIARAERSIEAAATRWGNRLKVIAGTFSEAIDEIEDSFERANRNGKRLKTIEDEADKREGIPEIPSGVRKKRQSHQEMVLENIGKGDITDLTLTALTLDSKDEKIRNAAEDLLRKRRFAQADKAGDDTQRKLADRSGRLLADGIGADPDNPAHARRRARGQRGAEVLGDMERRRIARMQGEFERIGIKVREEAGISAATTRLSTLGSLGHPIQIAGKKGAVSTYQPPGGSPAAPFSRSGLSGPLSMHPAGMVLTEAPIDDRSIAFGTQRKYMLPELLPPAAPGAPAKPRNPYTLMPKPAEKGLWDWIKEDIAGFREGLKPGLERMKWNRSATPAGPAAAPDTTALDAAQEKAGAVKDKVAEIGPAGQSAGSAMASGFNSGLLQMEASADATIARIQQKLNSLRAPTLPFGGGGGVGGFNTGKQGPN